MNINEETANGMCGTSNPSSLCKMSIQEKTEKEDDKQGEEKQSNKYNETSSSPDPPPRKKPRLDTPGVSGISRKPSSEESPSTDSIIAIDGKTKSPSPLEPSSKHYEPTEKDVVFGKGRFIQNLAGNVRLRKLIKSHFDQYEKADCPQDKTLMAMRLVADIKESGGRFLKEDASAPGLYIEVDSIAAREKIAATFHSHRRRSKLVVNIGTPTSEPKHVAFAARNTTSRPSAPLMMGAKTKDRMRPMIHGTTTVKDLGLVGRQGRVLGYPPLYASNLLQQELNQLPRRRAFHFSDELARISSMNTTTKLVPSFHKGSLIPGFDQADIDKYAKEVLREKMSRKQMETLKLGSPLFPIVLDDKPEAAVCRGSRLNSGSCAVSSGSDFAKNSQALFASSPLSAVKNSRLSMLSSQRMSSWPLGNSLRRFSPTSTTAPVTKDASTAFASSCSEPSKELMHYHATQEDLQAQLYREMGLPGF